MQNISRIPKLTDVSSSGAMAWFNEMHAQNLLFHPEDDPSEILVIATGAKTFSSIEVTEISIILDTMNRHLGHEKMLDAAYPIFMNACGLPVKA